MSDEPTNVIDRVHQLADEWRLTIDESFETNTSVISYVRRDGEAFVLKVIKQPGDEWRSGEVLKRFNGHGAVRVHECSDGAMLLQRLQPGTNLVELALSGSDEEATDILGEVIRKMSSVDAAAVAIENACPTVEDWGKGFARYLYSGDNRIPRDLVESAQQVFADLCATQTRKRLLHGDLQHYNVLFDSNHGWLAIDPKGVIGELEYEVGAILRNPIEAPDLFLSSAIIARRIDQLTSKLHLNRQRVLAWAFSQSVLSAIWDIEDGFEVDDSHPALKLAHTMRHSRQERTAKPLPSQHQH